MIPLRLVTFSGVALSLASFLPAQVPALSLKTFSGSGQAGSIDGPAGVATFFGLQGVIGDAGGNLYVASLDNTIRKITPQGTVTTLAGLAGQSGNSDGSGASARFTGPSGLAVDAGGNVYVADTLNYSIRKITPEGSVTTIVGPSANLAGPRGIAVDSSGTLYVADTQTSTIRKVTSQGTSILAGGAYLSGFIDGPAASARFKSPQGLALDPQGNLYVADSGNGAIRKIASDGSVSTVATGVGNPVALAIDAAGNLYVTDEAESLVLGISPSGSVSVVAGAKGSRGYRDGSGSASRLTVPCGIAAMPSGAVAIVDWEINAVRLGSPLSARPQAPQIEQQPASMTASANTSATFSVIAFGYPSPTYQWYRDGAPISAATGGTNADYIDYSVQPADAATYTVVVSNSAGSVTSAPALLTVSSSSSSAAVAPPVIETQPAAQAVAAGGSVTFTVGAANAASYQWQFNGTAIPGATASTLTLANVGATQAGSYSVLVGNANGTANSAANLVVNSDARLVNLSSRALVGTGGQALIAGFVISGSGQKQILLRGIGPTLDSFGVQGCLMSPQLALYSGAGATLASDSAWDSSPALSATMARVGAFALPPGSADSAFADTIASGAYSAQLTGSGGATGVALIEIYDGDYSASQSRVINLSTRAFVGTADRSLIAGFVITGSTSETLLIRGIGPALSGFGVQGALSSAQVTVLDSHGVTVAANSSWGGSASLASAFSRAGAFALAPDSSDSAVVVTLPAGAYTAQVSGQAGATGVGLVEIYELR